MTSTNTSIAKLAALVAGFGLVAMSFAVIPAHAQTTTTTSTSTMTTAQLQAQIAALMAQIAALQAQLNASGGTTVYVYTRDLTIGSRGADVSALQTWLISKGFSIPAGPTGYFGTQTRAAVAAFQAANGIVPAVGYFGPITRARIAAIVVVPGPTPVPGPVVLTGNGRLTDLSSLGDVETTLHEGDGLTKVTGFSADATDGDVMLQRLDVQFDVGSSGSQSSNLDRYVDTVSVYMNGKKLASMDASNGDKDGRTWTFRFSNLNGFIKRGTTADVYVEVTPVSGLGSNEIDKTVTVSIPSDGIRAIGADGLSDTYSVSGTSQSLLFSEATSGNLTLTAAGDNPSDSQVAVSDTDTTTDVDLLNFNIRAKNQESTITDLPVSFSTSDNNLNDVISRVRLMKGDTTLRTKTLGTGSYGTVTFDNVDLTAGQDSTTEYRVVADLKSATAYSSSTTVTASTTSSLAGWDVEDANGNTTNITGSAVGPTITLSTTGITVAKGSMTTQTTTGLAGGADTTQYALTFNVTAGDDDLYIDRSVQNAASPSAAGGGVAWATTTSSNSGVTDTGVASLTSANSDSGDTTTSYRIPAGTTRTFTVNVALTASGAGYTGVRLTGINYDTDSSTNDSTLYFTANLDTFKTNDIYMTTR